MPAEVNTKALEDLLAGQKEMQAAIAEMKARPATIDPEKVAAIVDKEVKAQLAHFRIENTRRADTEWTLDRQLEAAGVVDPDEKVTNEKTLVEHKATRANLRTGTIEVVDEEIAELQAKHDAWYWVKTCLTARHGADRVSDPAQFKSFLEYTRAVRTFADRHGIKAAMTSADAGLGLEWAAQAWTNQLFELVRLELAAVNLFEQFTIPRGYGTFTWPIQTSAAKVKRQPTQASDSTSLASSIGTSNVVYSPDKLIVIIQVSDELDEDSIVATMPTTMRECARLIWEGIEAAELEGDSAAAQHIKDMNGDTWSTSNSPEASWDGLRKKALALTGSNAPKIDFSGATLLATEATTKANLAKLYGRMKQYGTSANQTLVATILGTQGYAQLQYLDVVRLMINYGPGATVVAGAVPTIDGKRITISPMLREDTNTAGVSGGTTGTNTTSILTAYRPAFKLGIKRAMTAEVWREPLKGMFNVILTFRGDFKEHTGAQEPSKGILYDIGL